MANEYRNLTFEQRGKMFDDIHSLIKERVPFDDIKLTIMTIYGITDAWSCKSRWDIKSLDEFIKRVKVWSETKIILEDMIC